MIYYKHIETSVLQINRYNFLLYIKRKKRKKRLFMFFIIQNIMSVIYSKDYHYYEFVNKVKVL